MPASRRRVIRTLKSKLGFDEDVSGHHIWYTLRVDGKIIARTKISHGGRDISDKNLSMMARQMYISAPQLKVIIACRIFKEDYYDILRKKGKL